MKTFPSGARWVLAGVGTLFMAFLGVMAGNQYLSWRESADLQDRLADAAAGESSALRPGQQLPSVTIVGTEGVTTDILSFSRDADLFIVFLSISCEPCTESVRAFGEGTRNGEIRVVGVCEDDVEYANVYAEKNAIPFSVFSDTGSIFFEQYGVNVFPTVVGVHRGGEIAFVRHGADSGFGYDEAVKLLQNHRT